MKITMSETNTNAFTTIEEFEREFVVFIRPSSCVRDFLVQDCNGNYHRLQEINPRIGISEKK